MANDSENTTRGNFLLKQNVAFWRHSEEDDTEEEETDSAVIFFPIVNLT